MQQSNNSPRIALAHDSLVQQGGAERVLEDLHEIFLNAPLFVVVEHKKLKNNYKGWEIHKSFLQFFYNIFSNLQYYILLIPFAVSSLNFKNFDVVISSSSSWIKNIVVPKKTVHICYCHTPTRFLWSDKDYVKQELPFLLKPFGFILRMFLVLLRKWDYNGAQRVTHFIANSKEVQKRIKQYYNRDSIVIYPGIDFEFWTKSGQTTVIPESRKLDSGSRAGMTKKGGYFLIAGRLHAHKHNELIIEIFNELGLPLHVVGTGRQEQYLKSIAKSNIVFYGRVSDEELRDQYSGARGFIYPQIEDAGLMPLEAAACGTASIGIAKGGSLETIIPGVTGELFSEYNKEKIKHIVQNWDEKKYLLSNLRNHASKFTKKEFKKKIQDFIFSKINS